MKADTATMEKSPTTPERRRGMDADGIVVGAAPHPVIRIAKLQQQMRLARQSDPQSPPKIFRTTGVSSKEDYSSNKQQSSKASQGDRTPVTPSSNHANTTTTGKSPNTLRYETAMKAAAQVQQSAILRDLLTSHKKLETENRTLRNQLEEAVVTIRMLQRQLEKGKQQRAQTGTVLSPNKNTFSPSSSPKRNDTKNHESSRTKPSSTITTDNKTLKASNFWPTTTKRKKKQKPESSLQRAAALGQQQHHRRHDHDGYESPSKPTTSDRHNHKPQRRSPRGPYDKRFLHQQQQDISTMKDDRRRQIDALRRYELSSREIFPEHSHHYHPEEKMMRELHPSTTCSTECTEAY